MSGSFRVLITAAFEREFRSISKRDAALVRALGEVVQILQADPHNRTGRYPIKKLAGLDLGEGQWRVRWGNYRVRYDVDGNNVVLHSFRHRKDAY